MGQAKPLSGPDLTKGVEIAKLVENVPLLGHANGEAVMLVRKSTGIYAISSTCSHYSAPLDEGMVAGDTVRCPWHHACFDLRTGEATGGPALEPIACYEVKSNGVRISVGAKLTPPMKPSPANAPDRIVIAGAGAAGAAAAEKLRRLGYLGTVTLIGSEPPGPVDRPNLSKDFLAGTAPMEWITLRDDAFYAGMNIELVREEIVALDTAAKSVALKSGRTLPYDRLLLATGAEPMRLPIEGASGPNVFTLRSLGDAQEIIAAAGKAKRVAIIGTSFIGLEVAASLRARNLEVHVIGRDQVPLANILGAEVGAFVRTLHEDKGVRFHFDAKVRAIHADGVELESGKVPADFVVLGVGVKPRVELAQRAGLTVDNGVVVDARLRTSAPDVWAAGDIARYPDPRLGTPVRIEHWQAAQRQAQAAAADMLGLGKDFNDVPFFWSQHYDVTLNYIGHAGGDAEIKVLGSLKERDATVVYRVNDHVAAVLTVNRDRQSLELEAALESRDWGGVDAMLMEF